MICKTIFIISFLGYTNAEKVRVQFPAEKVAQILPVAMSCISETGVNPDILVKSLTVKPSNDKQLDKFIYCVFTNMGYVDKNGLVKIEEAVKLFPKSYKKEVRDTMEQCNLIAMKKRSPSDKIVKFYFCFMENSPVMLGP